MTLETNIELVPSKPVIDGMMRIVAALTAGVPIQASLWGQSVIITVKK